jgi:hypothetical protein
MNSSIYTEKSRAPKNEMLKSLENISKKNNIYLANKFYFSNQLRAALQFQRDGDPGSLLKII